MYKLIIFDLGGVLFTNGTFRFRQALAARYPLSYEEVRQVLDGGIGYEYRKGKVSRDEFWQQARKRLKLKETADALEQEWVSLYELIPETKAIVLTLGKKYQVWYLSNNVKERVETLEKKFGFKKWFNGGIFSHEVGLIKPDPQIYRLIVDKAQVKPEEAVFIDDKETSLAPAKALGITPILFTSANKLKSKLRRLKIL